MAQRWMQAKKILMRTHGRTTSGAGRATGDVWDDRPIGWVDSPIKPAAKKEPKRMPCQKADKPKPWRYMGGDPTSTGYGRIE